MQSRLPVVKLGPRYRVVDEIAAGGMGTVVLAIALRSTGPHAGVTPVAIKKLHAHLVDNSEVVSSFVDEARIASRILHPNVVNVHDVEMIGNELMIIMDYVEGIPLRDFLKGTFADRGLPIPVVRRILVDALHGLHAAHELTDDSGVPLDVVHRDVSPHNLLVGTNGVTSVTDFGIAMAAGRIASTKADGAVKGKLQYLSPEQVFRKPIDRRTDVFAAGAVLWEALVGRKLFDAGTEGETLAMIIREPIQPPSSHRIEVPLDLDEICLRALEREPERRFSSAEELAFAIEDGGPLASREEVAVLVFNEAGDVLERRHQLLERAIQTGSLPPPSSIRPAALAWGEPAADDDDPTNPPASRAPVPSQSPASMRTALVPRRRPPAAGRSISPIALMIVASVCVSGGLLIGFSVRDAPPRPPAVVHRPEPTPPTTTTTTPTTITPTPTTPIAEPSPTTPPGAIFPTPVASADTAPAPTAPAIRSTRVGHERKPTAPTSKADAGRGGRPFMPDDL